MKLTENDADGRTRISSDQYPLTRIIDEGFRDRATRTAPNWLLAIGLIAGVVISCGLILPFYLFAAIFYFGIRWRFNSMAGFAYDVDDGGDHLIARQADRSRRIEITQIQAVIYLPYNNPPRIQLRLRTGTIDHPDPNRPLTDVITFVPDLSRGRDAARGIADELRRRTVP